MPLTNPAASFPAVTAQTFGGSPYANPGGFSQTAAPPPMSARSSTALQPGPRLSRAW
jgi:hypothetical protein